MNSRRRIVPPRRVGPANAHNLALPKGPGTEIGLMSELGQNPTSSSECLMPALPSTADIHQGGGYVGFVPKSDIDSITIRPLRWQGSETEREHPAVRVAATMGTLRNAA